MSMRLPAALRASVDIALAAAVSQRWASRIWDRDTALWTQDPAVAESIANRLGWLDAPTTFRDGAAELQAMGAALAQEGCTDALICGMGGSSLAPEVLSLVLPRAESGMRISVLDSTDPAAVLAADAALDSKPTVHVIATKSGTTTETLAFLAHFWQAAAKQTRMFHRSDAGNSFVGITDPGTSMEGIPHLDIFREYFLNPVDVGGRYSALTYVGLVPAALQGLDLTALLDDAQQMASRCLTDDAANPGLELGVAIGALAAAGRDKLTFVIEPALAALGGWLEQLIAESTGKLGTGIVPVDGEPLAAPAAYGNDRVFVRVGRPGHTSDSDAALDALAAAGHPVIEVVLTEGGWVGGEFFRWEFATAVAGIMLGVNPFDEPNVTESKNNTRAVLEQYRHAHALPEADVIAQAGALRLEPDANLTASATSTDLTALLRQHFDRVPEAGYHAICAYVAPSPERSAALRLLQALLRDHTRHATTLGYGPRFLHSTGQLHKGGPAVGCFLQLVAGHPIDLPIPGSPETFGVLIDAQALGDFASLQTHGLPVLRVHLSDDPDQGLAELLTAVSAALA